VNSIPISVGTGKTLIGVKIAYWYTEWNKRIAVDGYTTDDIREQVLFCGPSNSSVDVAASKYSVEIIIVISLYHPVICMSSPFYR